MKTERTARAVLSGERVGWRAYLSFLGPAMVASVAYIDPGNFATNIQAGARYGYDLLWVVVMANMIAMLFQALSAKLGIVTGRNLAEMCRERLPAPLVWPMWIISEIAAMATDLAEFLGGAIGLSLLLGWPLIWGMIAVAIIVWAILAFEKTGFRPIELVVGLLVAVVALCYLVELVLSPVNWRAAALGAVTPKIEDARALMLAVGIIGATVMPHAVFLHSGLTQARTPGRNESERRQLVRISNVEVVGALALAGLTNMAMVMMAAGAFHAGHPEVAEIENAYHTLTPLLGKMAAAVFLVSLLASGVASSAVGTMAGQVVMQGFVGFRIPVAVRRLVTMAPAFAVVLMGYDATQSLVMSQVVLSLALPVPMIALVAFTRRADVMGAFRNSRAVDVLAILATLVVLGLNVVLVLSALEIPLPFGG
ncbi:MAG: Nramp family divalent metal transporter [Beijerinckiaceae bacterium]